LEFTSVTAATDNAGNAAVEASRVVTIVEMMVGGEGEGEGGCPLTGGKSLSDVFGDLFLLGLSLSVLLGWASVRRRC